MKVDEVGRRLAERHVAAAELNPQIEIDPTRSMLNYAEVAHTGDWTLRSALVRLAQPHPTEVGALLQAMRRLDAPLHHVAKALLRRPAWSDPTLARIETIDDAIDCLVSQPAAAPEADARLADLARLVAAGLDPAGLIDGYGSVAPLDQEEKLALPLLALAVGFADLAADLAVWADAGADRPPLDQVVEWTATLLARLDELGVPEEGPPPRSPRSRG